MKNFLLSFLFGLLLGALGVFGYLYVQSTPGIDKNLSSFQRTQKAGMTLWSALTNRSASNPRNPS